MIVVRALALSGVSVMSRFAACCPYLDCSESLLGVGERDGFVFVV